MATSPLKAALPVPSMIVPPRMTMSCMPTSRMGSRRRGRADLLLLDEYCLIVGRETRARGCSPPLHRHTVRWPSVSDCDQMTHCRRGDRMRRRKFVLGMTVTMAAGLCPPSQAQQATKQKIGFLIASSKERPAIRSEEHTSELQS